MSFSEVYWLYLITEGRKDLIIAVKSVFTPLFDQIGLMEKIQETLCMCVYVYIYIFFSLKFLIKLKIRGYVAYNEQVLSIDVKLASLCISK